MLKEIQIRNTAWLFVFIAAAFSIGCQAPATNGNANLMNANVVLNANNNANSINMNISNANMMNETSVIETKEPEQYQATVKLQFQTSGEQKRTTPPLQAQVARDGANRRLELNAPNGEKIVYLETGGKKLLISPQRKQFGELNKESLGFDVQSFMMPDQIINRLENMKGVERVGEETYNGREAIKYRYGAMTNTQTKAGAVETESFILVDKETGLPLRSVTNSQAQGGNVQGVNGVTLVTELSDIKTTIDPNLFAAPPTDYKQVEPEQIRQQVNQLFNVAMTIIGQLMKSAQPAATATP